MQIRRGPARVLHHPRRQGGRDRHHPEPQGGPPQAARRRPENHHASTPPGTGEVTAGGHHQRDGNVEILNPDHYIATLSAKATLQDGDGGQDGQGLRARPKRNKDPSSPSRHDPDRRHLLARSRR
ncbi:MAG: hypothetical protein MZV70_34460 [Desulfobacterales bacterium]|nr:hypothetical protein [Desulfobacterales bacterium]